MGDPARDDAELVRRLKAGDPAAFDEVYDAYRPRLFGFLCRLAGRRHIAEELLQETWLRLARRASQLRDDTRLGPWLFTVARNLHVSYRRWTLREINRPEDALRPSPSASPFDLASASQLERRLERGLAALPLRYREALLLVAVERMAHADAAAVLRLSPAALRKRLSRARALLRAELSDEFSARARRKAMK